MLDKAFDKEDVGALKTVIELLRDTLAAHPGGPAAATAAVPNAHVPASAPPANSAPAVHPPPPAPLPLPLNAAPSSGRAHSDSLDSLPPPAKRRRDVWRVPDSFLDKFSAFTYQRGIDHIAAGENIHTLTNTMLFDAYKAQHQLASDTQLHHYFSRPEWTAAVIARDPAKFRGTWTTTLYQESAQPLRLF